MAYSNLNSRINFRRNFIEIYPKKNTQEINKLIDSNMLNIDCRGLSIDLLEIRNKTVNRPFCHGSIFSNSHFEGVVFNYAEFRGARFTNSNFKNTQFKKSVLIGASFENCQLTDVQFDQCDFSGARFKNTTLKNISYLRCNMYNCNLSSRKRDIFRRVRVSLKQSNIIDYIARGESKFEVVNRIRRFSVYLFLRILSHSEIPFHSIIVGKNCTFGHLGHGIFIAAGTEIGNNVWIGPKVSLFGRNNIIKIGDNAIIGLGSIVSGSVGDNAIIGAGSVVIDNVPANSLVFANKSTVFSDEK
jgi:uncharacterized protein YjbI with pentapeptide repeats